MRILLISLNYEPELTGIGKFNGEMARWLVERGHQVCVITAPPYYPDWQIRAGYDGLRYRRERRAGVDVIRCPLFVPARVSGVGRLVHLLSFAVSCMPAVLAKALTWKPALVMVTEPPLMAAPAALVAARLCGARTQLHVQDLEVDAAFELGLLKGGRLRRMARALEVRIMRRFDRISTISPRMLGQLAAKGLGDARLALLPNWADLDRIRPLAKPSPWRARLGLGADEIVVLYAGTMGRKQGLETVIEAARLLRANRRVVFVLCGQGAGRSELERRAAGLERVCFLPLQPAEDLNDVLNLADIHLLPQRTDAGDLVMPSKLGGMLASGRPVIAGARPGTQVYDAVATCGLAVPPEDAQALAQAIELLASNAERRQVLGIAARVEALAHWSRDFILRRFEAMALGEPIASTATRGEAVRAAEPVEAIERQ